MINEIDNDLERLEISMEQAEKFVATKDKIENLIMNTDFIEIILKGYLEKEAIRLVSLKAEPALQKEEDQIGIIKEIDAIGHLRRYLTQQIRRGKEAEASLEEDRKTREELLKEAVA